MSPVPPDLRRYVCIHGHFYQPPRENAWLEAIEAQDSASPYHDWNQRINTECYAPNATARILDDQDRITRIVNNYERISFNFGPTLLSWLERHDAETYGAIVAADRNSRARFGGHGSAIAQAYNHAILPLCNARDKRTQVIWGLADFRRRFGREAEGLWLPETAADLATLEVLAAEGVRFTVLAPRQAAAVRAADGAFQNVSGGVIDPRRAYHMRLPSGRDIALFFYDGPISQAVAFERLLSRGDRFAARIVAAFDPRGDHAQLVHVATDGETYGHHHRFGEMALAFTLQAIEDGNDARLTNYGEFLANHPPEVEVRIAEPSSWSCVHGVGRWSDDCGCNSGIYPTWHQRWRRPLREALDDLRNDLAPAYEHHARQLLRDPWAARDAYIDVVLDRSAASLQRFMGAQATGGWDEAETSRALGLLEMQRNAMLMYTSCGWFFDEVSGIETQQILQYAARALELAESSFEAAPARQRFMARLAAVPSNLPEFGDAQHLFETMVEPARADMRKVGANWAAGLLFDDGRGRIETPAYSVDCPEHQAYSSGNARLVLGRLEVKSHVTLEREVFSFAFVYPGEPRLRGGVRRYEDAERQRTMRSELVEAFGRGDLEGVDALLARHFPGALCSLRTLFHDEQQRIVHRILEGTLAGVEQVYQRLYDEHAPLLRMLTELETGQPRALRVAAELVAGKRLQAELGASLVDPERLERVLQDAKAQGVALDRSAVGFAAREGIDRWLRCVADRPTDTVAIARATHAVRLVRGLPFHVDLRSAENRFYRMTHDAGLTVPAAAADALRELGRYLGVAVPERVGERSGVDGGAPLQKTTE